jgi:hypothetical protein
VGWGVIVGGWINVDSVSVGFEDVTMCEL